MIASGGLLLPRLVETRLDLCLNILFGLIDDRSEVTGLGPKWACGPAPVKDRVLRSAPPLTTCRPVFDCLAAELHRRQNGYGAALLPSQ